ncbi:MAG: Catabolic 3-dehydroquinate dehydratase [Elusimicrobia bacterium]|nr:Catabolic 3-dehydroquinate dehydratase [Elusimicrobiota bacterium]
MKQSFLSSKKDILSHRPLVVGTLTSQSPLGGQIQNAKTARIDLLEVRLDGYSAMRGPFQKAQEFGRNLIREIKTRTQLPVLLTFRAADEGGAIKTTSVIEDYRRGEILSRLLPLVEMIDVEIQHEKFAHRMTVLGHLQQVDVIHSVHDFKGPGHLAQLSQLALRSKKLNGDVFKVAVSPRSIADLEKFLWWGKDLPNKQVVLIGMGKWGIVSRVAAYSFGSILTYGHLGRSAAPGQIPAKALSQSVRHAYAHP